MTTFCLRVRQAGRISTLRGIDVETIERTTTVSAVPGCQFGMALVRGQILPVLQLGQGNGCLVVGRVRGELLGIFGLDVIGLETDDADSRPSSLGGYVDLTSEPDVSGVTEPSDFESASELDVEALLDLAKTRPHKPAQSSEELP